MSDLGLADYPLSLKAGKWQKLAVPGNYIQISQGTSWVYLRCDSGSIFARRPSSGSPVVSYNYVEVMSIADQDVVVCLGFTAPGAGPFDSGAIFAGTVNVVSDNATLRSSPGDVTVAAGAQVQVAAVDATRIRLTVQLDDGAVGPVRVGDATVDATHGLKLQPDDAAEATGKPAVYVFNPNAADVVVHLDAEFIP